MQQTKGLIDRGAWKVVLKRDMPLNSNVLSSRLELTVQNSETNASSYKEILIAQGHRYKDKNYILHNSTTRRHAFIRLISSIAASYNFRIYNDDVT